MQLQEATTVMTTLIASIVAFIAIQQFFLARERFKLDLFEKRFAIFKAAQKFIDAILRDRKISGADLQQFDREIEPASFLFDEDIVNFLEQIRTKANVLTVYRDERLQLEPGDARVKASEKDWKILEEFITTQGGLKNKFSPYLKFKNWKHGFLW